MIKGIFTVGLIVLFSVCVSAQRETFQPEKKISEVRSEIKNIQTEPQRAESLQVGRAGTDEQNQVSVIALLGRIVGFLLLFIVLGLAVVIVMRRRSGNGKVSTAGVIDVLEHVTLMQGRYISMVRISDEVLVLGHTAETMCVLKQFSGDAALEILSSQKGDVKITQFKEVFQAFFKKGSSVQ